MPRKKKSKLSCKFTQQKRRATKSSQTTASELSDDSDRFHNNTTVSLTSTAKDVTGSSSLTFLDAVPLSPSTSAETASSSTVLEEIPSMESPNTMHEEIEEHRCGKLDVVCNFCSALHFKHERPSDGKFTTCCQKGKVSLNPFKNPPEILFDLLTGKHPLSSKFQENIRNYNSAYGFASMGANIVTPQGHGPYCFRIQGQIYHRTGTLHPPDEEDSTFAQLYILDPEDAVDARMNNPQNTQCDRDVMKLLNSMMLQVSPLTHAHKMLYEVEQEAIQESQRTGCCIPKISMVIKQNRQQGLRRYNQPRTNEVAIVFSNADGEPPLERDLLIHLRPSSDEEDFLSVLRISVLDPNLDPMVYPMFFPHGDQGWSTEMKLAGAGKRVRVTQMQYYGFRFAIRNEFNILHSGGKLTQQFFVDSFIRTEANRLNFIRTNQSKLRVELYSGLQDHINSDAAALGIPPGRPVILPSSFQGSPRNMQQNYQDAMAIVRKYGKPDLFITMTCNPLWTEITENLQPYQRSEHRPDIVARVFNVKLHALLNDIWKKNVLGKVIAKIHVIEFQKLGLPHAHILLILDPNDKLRTEDQIDAIVDPWTLW